MSGAGRAVSVGIDPRSLVHPGIWTEAAIHVDGIAGADGNSGSEPLMVISRRRRRRSMPPSRPGMPPAHPTG